MLLDSPTIFAVYHTAAKLNNTHFYVQGTAEAIKYLAGMMQKSSFMDAQNILTSFIIYNLSN